MRFRQMELDEEAEKSKKPKSKMKATKDFKLLSFGDEAEEEEDNLKDVQVVFMFNYLRPTAKEFLKMLLFFFLFLFTFWFKTSFK